MGAPEGDSPVRKAVLSNAEGLSKFFIFCLVLLLTIIVIKLQSKNTFTIGNVEIGTDDASLAVAALSIAHQILTSYFVISIYAFRDNRSFEERKCMFDEITVAGPLLFRGLKPRQLLRPGSKIYVLSATDPTSWAYSCFAILIPLACVPFPTHLSDLEIMPVVIALFLMAANWIIGSNWALAVGELAVEEEPLAQPAKRQGRDRPMKGGMRPEDLRQLLKGLGAASAIFVFYLSGLILIGVYYYLK